MNDRSDKRGPSTRAVHAGVPAAVQGDPVVTPLVSSATFYNDPGTAEGLKYARYGNTPNHEVLAAKLAALEGSDAAIVLGSGMAAISLTLLAFAGSGDHVLASRQLYGGTLELLTTELPRLGIGVDFVDMDGRWSEALRPNTRLLYTEIPVNPTLRVPDLRPLGAIGREHGIPLIVDATFATPINCRPLEHGVDVVIHSGTKYLGGHTDLVAGVVAGPEAVIDEVALKRKRFGPAADAHMLWLLERGIKTLAIRVERQNRTALALARWLADHTAVDAVHYPGLEGHPDHQVARELMDGFGGMLSFVVKGGDGAALDVMRRFELIAVAPSLGGVESLASMPRYTSHAGLDADERRRLGIDDGFIRLSVGIEDEADLRADLEAALG